jgi:hypothetical protein
MTWIQLESCHPRKPAQNRQKSLHFNVYGVLAFVPASVADSIKVSNVKVAIATPI